jgi:hypothetical protein
MRANGEYMKKIALATALGVALALPLASPALAGYRIQEVDPEFPGDVTTYWFQGGKVRVEGALEGLTMIVDVKGGEGWLIDAAHKRYAGGPLAALAAELAKLDEQAIEEAAPEEGAGADEEADEEAGAPAKPHRVEVKDLGAGEPLLGHETRRHQVFVDGELIEELWVAPKVDVAAEVDAAAFASAMQKMLGSGLSAGQGYEESAAYRALRASGYPLRQVLYFVGEKSVLEVTSVSVQSIPATDFGVPKGLTRVGYAELLLGEEE